MCDLCGLSGGNVGVIRHSQMVADRPYAKDACDRCAKALALRYYRNGGTPVLAGRPSGGQADDATDGGQGGAADGTSREW